MRHGGDLAAASARYGRPVADWIDLSTGINPHAYPIGALAAPDWQRLPQADAEAALLAAARQAYGVPGGAHIVAAPGTQMLIQLAARLRDRAPVAIVGPTYSEHAIAWRREGGDVRTVASLDHAVSAADVVVVVNPNNPDGRTWPPEDLRAASETLAARSGLLVVDEAFADVRPAVSVCSMAGRNGLLVLRSFGKFYGLAGVRLGFAVGRAADIDRVAGWLGPWSVSGPAMALGARALADIEWAEAMRATIGEASARFNRALADCGLEVIGDAGLFRLTRHAHAHAIHDALAAQGIWTRIFDDQPDWLRLGLPADGDQDCVTAALSQAMAEYR